MNNVQWQVKKIDFFQFCNTKISEIKKRLSLKSMKKPRVFVWELFFISLNDLLLQIIL